MPKTMRAAAIDQYGGPEVLALPIAVYTAGVGGWDADIRDGRDGWNPCGRIRFPFVLGTDGSGTIAHLGSRVHRFKVGGAKVLAVASGPDGVALTRRLGADAAVDGHSADFVQAAFKFAPKGVDAVLVLGSGDAVPRCFDALRQGGRLAYPRGVEPAPEKVRGLRVIAYDAKAGGREFEKLNRAVQKAKLHVPIAAEFGLHDAAETHRRVGQGHVLGKIVLRIR